MVPSKSCPPRAFHEKLAGVFVSPFPRYKRSSPHPARAPPHVTTIAYNLRSVLPAVHVFVLLAALLLYRAYYSPINHTSTIMSVSSFATPPAAVPSRVLLMCRWLSLPSSAHCSPPSSSTQIGRARGRPWLCRSVAQALGYRCKGCVLSSRELCSDSGLAPAP